jgi:hypothetical protein
MGVTVRLQLAGADFVLARFDGGEYGPQERTKARAGNRGTEEVGLDIAADLLIGMGEDAGTPKLPEP